MSKQLIPHLQNINKQFINTAMNAFFFLIYKHTYNVFSYFVNGQLIISK